MDDDPEKKVKGVMRKEFLNSFIMNFNVDKIKIVTRKFIKNVLKLLWIFPVKKDQIMFISYTGDYSDSPKYIYKELLNRDVSYKYVWAVNTDSENEQEISMCKKIRYGSFAYLLEIIKSQVVITNNYLNTYIPRRKKQVFINTWHGGSPTKTIGLVNDDISDFDRFFYKEHAEKYSLYISNSEFMTETVFKKSFGYHGSIYRCGLPRNAVLYRDNIEIKDKVAKYFNIPIDENNGIILYAPTFRGDFRSAKFISNEQQFDINICIREMEKRFKKKYTFLFRSHYFGAEVSEGCYDASAYPDMQELLAVSDVLITDYSSCMGDMCIMYKPVFLYVPDLEEYLKNRGLYWNIYDLPFPVSENEVQFVENIKKFSFEKYNEAVSEYFRKIGTHEGPDMDIKFVDYLCEIMENEKR